jgi:phenylpropionate dioxygenase-like ring-hydroxylating dioxygenase large terminal subunit
MSSQNIDPLAGFWYVAALSEELNQHTVLSRRILDRALVLYRDNGGKPVVAYDRCLHRCGKLSAGGKTANGRLVCPYHGWQYGTQGRLESIPSEGGQEAADARNLKLGTVAVQETEGFIYVCLSVSHQTPPPFSMPGWNDQRIKRVRLVNDFENSVTNCVENFVDVPHTATVHARIFRDAKGDAITANVTAQNGVVSVDYAGERSNLGAFAWAINPRGLPVSHQDYFHAPNITHVCYGIGKSRFLITSQCTPVRHGLTRVYTELAWEFGWLTPFAGPFVRRQAQAVIAQDQAVLKDQWQVINERPGGFLESPADVIHLYIHEIRAAVESGQDLASLPTHRTEIRFWV